MSGHLDLLVPDWQGYGEDRRAFHGALALRDGLRTSLAFATVDVPERESLAIEAGVLGYRSNLRILKDVCDLLATEKPETVFMIGGTCAAEIGPVSFLNDEYGGDLTVLWLDAHGDLNTPQSSPSRHLHGMPLRILLGEGPDEFRSLLRSRLRPSQVLLAGSRDLDPPEQAYIEANRVTSLPIAAVAEADTLVACIRERKSRNLYVHLDLDVLEPKDFPHLLIPTPGGVKFAELLEALGRLRAEFSIVGSSIVEYVPVRGGDPERMQRLVETLRPSIR